jgi:hypothetical protein
VAEGKHGYKVKQISQHTLQPMKIFTSHNNIHKNDRKHTKPVRDFRLLALCKWDLLWDGTQHELVLVTDVSGQPISPIFKGQAVQEEFWSDQLLKMSRLFWNVSNYQYILCNIQKSENLIQSQHLIQECWLIMVCVTLTDVLIKDKHCC